MCLLRQTCSYCCTQLWGCSYSRRGKVFLMGKQGLTYSFFLHTRLTIFGLIGHCPVGLNWYNKGNLLTKIGVPMSKHVFKSNNKDTRTASIDLVLLYCYCLTNVLIKTKPLCTLKPFSTFFFFCLHTIKLYIESRFNNKNMRLAPATLW